MKLFIVSPKNNREGVYHLLTEEGEHLASHFCSSIGFAKGDLINNRPERQEKFKEKFGDYTVHYLEQDSSKNPDGLSIDVLIERNRIFYKDQIEAEND